MKLSTLNRAIENAIIDPIGVNSNEDFTKLLKARDEIIELSKICDEGMDADVTVLSWYALSNLMNVATYDFFGPIRKEYGKNERAQTRFYRDAVHSNICEELTNAQIDGVADFLSDLWDDNEDNGSHNESGCFKSSTLDEDLILTLNDRITTLGTIINKLYHHRGLSPEDLDEIQLYIH